MTKTKTCRKPAATHEAVSHAPLARSKWNRSTTPSKSPATCQEIPPDCSTQSFRQPGPISPRIPHPLRQHPSCAQRSANARFTTSPADLPRSSISTWRNISSPPAYAPKLRHTCVQHLRRHPDTCPVSYRTLFYIPASDSAAR